MTTHPDTCPMREGDSQRRSLVRFVGGPMCGDGWLPARALLFQRLLITPSRYLYGIDPRDYVIVDRTVARPHRYRVVDAHRVEHLEAL